MLSWHLSFADTRNRYTDDLVTAVVIAVKS
jgi:hypothetical protein